MQPCGSQRTLPPFCPCFIMKANSVLDTPAFNVVLHHICSWTISTTPNVLIAKDPTWFYLRISHLFTDHYNAALTNCFSQITIEHSNASTWWSIDVLPGHLDNHIVLTAFSSLLWLRRVVNIRAAPVLPIIESSHNKNEQNTLDSRILLSENKNKPSIKAIHKPNKK